MTFWDWLASPIGIEAQHALITLLLAAAAYLSFLAHRQSKTNEQLLNGHLEQHALNDALSTPLVRDVGKTPTENKPMPDSGKAVQ